jgi:molybdopterin adenylyltransferase
VSVEEHRRAAETGPLGFALVTVSDTRDEASDRSGARLGELVERAGHRVARREIVRDDPEAICAALVAALGDSRVDALLVTGGTGVAPRDRTVEAARPLFERELPGFGELFRALSFAQIGPAAMLSRATAGVATGKAIFLLPGSPAALDLALERLVLPEIAHLLAQARRAD